MVNNAIIFVNFQLTLSLADFIFRVGGGGGRYFTTGDHSQDETWSSCNKIKTMLTIAQIYLKTETSLLLRVKLTEMAI